MIRSRLKVFLLPGLLLAGLCLCGAAVAAPSQAHQELERTINEVLSELQKPELKQPATRNAVLGRVEKIIDRLFSFEELSARTVGAAWNKFSPDQKKRFIDVFTTLLRESSLAKLDGYNGEQVVYTGEVTSPKGDRTEVRTVITMKDSKKVPVAYRMLPKDGTWFVYDVLIENISLVKNYRTQFQDILNTGSPDQLIARVKAKAQEVRQGNGQ